MIERHADAPADAFLLALAWCAHVERERRIVAWSGRHALCGDLRADAVGGYRQFWSRLDALETVLEIADDLIEADQSQPRRRLVLASRVGDDHNRLLAAQHGAGPGGILAAETDVDAGCARSVGIR